jgi:uncharacterized protein (DUF1499 family)
MAGALVLITAALFLGGAVGLFSGQRPGNLGAREGRLAPCASTPNCVSSQADPNDSVHYIAPYSLAGPVGSAWSVLVSVVRDQQRSAIVEEKPGYLYAEFTSRLMGYVDDVEFLLNEKSSVIEVRSASRLGSSDFGVNRKRIEAIRAAYTARLAAPSSPGR